MNGARNLHRIAGALHAARIAACKGACGIGPCTEPAVGYIEGWTARPVGVCERHAQLAPHKGYTVYTLADLGEGQHG